MGKSSDLFLSLQCCNGITDRDNSRKKFVYANVIHHCTRVRVKRREREKERKKTHHYGHFYIIYCLSPKETKKQHDEYRCKYNCLRSGQKDCIIE